MLNNVFNFVLISLSELIQLHYHNSISDLSFEIQASTRGECASKLKRNWI